MVDSLVDESRLEPNTIEIRPGLIYKTLMQCAEQLTYQLLGYCQYKGILAPYTSISTCSAWRIPVGRTICSVQVFAWRLVIYSFTIRDEFLDYIILIKVL